MVTDGQRMVTVADCGAVRQQTPSKWSLARGIFLELCRIDGLEIWICLLNIGLDI